jgi:hypothetical protein
MRIANALAPYILFASLTLNAILLVLAAVPKPGVTEREQQAWVHGVAAIRSEAECWKGYTDLLKRQAGK